MQIESEHTYEFPQNNAYSLTRKKKANDSAFEDMLGKFDATRMCM
jgi:hypothetical protein